MRLSWIAMGACLAGLVTGCATDGQSGDNTKTIGGATIGALLGGLVGASASHGDAGSTIAGAMAGGLVGGLIGYQMDERDREMRNAALVRSLQTAKTNQTLTWTNPTTGNSGTIKPLSGYTKAANSQSCRDFGESYTRDGHTYTQQSRACRDPNGEWKVVSS